MGKKDADSGLGAGRPTQRTTQKPQNTLTMCRGFSCEFSGFSVDRRRFALAESARTGYQELGTSDWELGACCEQRIAGETTCGVSGAVRSADYDGGARRAG